MKVPRDGQVYRDGTCQCAALFPHSSPQGWTGVQGRDMSMCRTVPTFKSPGMDGCTGTGHVNVPHCSHIQVPRDGRVYRDGTCHFAALFPHSSPQGWTGVQGRDMSMCRTVPTFKSPGMDGCTGTGRVTLPHCCHFSMPADLSSNRNITQSRRALTGSAPRCVTTQQASGSCDKWTLN
jgi:hypothetical protein